MANSRKKGVIYVDATGTITVDAMKPVLHAIMITPSAANSRVVIKESVSGNVVVDVLLASVETSYISFEAFKGIELTSSFEVSTLTSITTVLLYGSWLSPVGSAR